MFYSNENLFSFRVSFSILAIIVYLLCLAALIAANAALNCCTNPKYLGLASRSSLIRKSRELLLLS